MRRPSRRISRVLGFTVVPASLLATGLFVTASSYSVFNATTSNPNNSWTAGRITLTNDSSAAASFNVSNIKPGSSGSRCIVVSYTGGSSADNAAATVKLYANVAGYTNTLAGALNLTINQGSGTAGSGSCTGFTSSGSVYSGTLTGFEALTSYNNAATGVWGTRGDGTAETKTYQISWNWPTTNTTDFDNGYQGKQAQVDFVWEAQTT